MIGDKNNLIELIKAKWEKCETENTEVFRYKLNVTGEKILDGNFNFLIQVRKVKFMNENLQIITRNTI